MSSTDAALSWLLSLDAACTSSPFPTSASPNFTDWLHISPTANSPSTEPTSLPASDNFSPPLKDITSSSRVNPLQTEVLRLNYFYDVPDFFSSETRVNLAALDAYARYEDGLQTILSPASFNCHSRMLSLESTSATLIGTPSPRSLSFFSPSGTAVTQDSKSHQTSQVGAIASPATKLIQELQRTSFPSHILEFTSPSHLADSLSDISPVIRSDKLQELDAAGQSGGPDVNAKKKKKRRRTKNIVQPTPVVERLRTAPPACERPHEPEVSAQPLLETAPPRPSTPLASLASAASTEPALLSPCHLVPAWESRSAQLSPPKQKLLGDSNEPIGVSAPAPASPFGPVHPLTPLSALSPLSPLTDLSSSPDITSPAPPPLKITLRIKRKMPDIDSSTPPRPPKIARKRVVIESPLSSPSESVPHRSPSPQVTSQPDKKEFTTRKLPAGVDVSPNYPLFYRRFPVSSYYQPPHLNSPCTIFGVSDPGGNYNPPRSALDLYTPRFVKGRGSEKVGLCPICVEPLGRGGENKRFWLAMKFSAFKYYHMQYAHGISAATGLPFSPPIAFRMVARQNPGKKEKHRIEQGKCHQCDKWIAVEGIKAVDTKVKELYWFALPLPTGALD
ncbi:hypothetical protein CVT26_015007 [Gymnopilus dilepis]|uniref:Transcription regulator Rua1 C-terminal domain-containing protein n=1 Tax=Gymnopilus dilepis TaxID=231916 RepID=A0A409YNK6_9AGAR|nr:hypothetical protein CVT26_015007 [Gymnopilus dilepis]